MVIHSVAGILTKAAQDAYNAKAEEQSELRTSYEKKDKEFREKLDQLKPKKKALDAEIPITVSNPSTRLT